MSTSAYESFTDLLGPSAALNLLLNAEDIIAPTSAPVSAPYWTSFDSSSLPSAPREEFYSPVCSSETVPAPHSSASSWEAAFTRTASWVATGFSYLDSARSSCESSNVEDRVAQSATSSLRSALTRSTSIDSFASSTITTSTSSQLSSSTVATTASRVVSSKGRSLRSRSSRSAFPGPLPPSLKIKRSPSSLSKLTSTNYSSPPSSPTSSSLYFDATSSITDSNERVDGTINAHPHPAPLDPTPLKWYENFNPQVLEKRRKDAKEHQEAMDRWAAGAVGYSWKNLMRVESVNEGRAATYVEPRGTMGVDTVAVVGEMAEKSKGAAEKKLRRVGGGESWWAWVL